MEDNFFSRMENQVQRETVNRWKSSGKNCAVCRFLINYIPVMTEKTIECFACNEIIRAATDSRRSPKEKDIGSIAKKRRKKRKRFRLTMPPEEKTPHDENQETDRFYMPESFTIYSNNAQDQYTPDTPESASSFREQTHSASSPIRDYNDNGKLNGNKCDGCEAIRFGAWVECSACSAWRCYRCVPNIDELSHEEAVYNCERCEPSAKVKRLKSPKQMINF